MNEQSVESNEQATAQTTIELQQQQIAALQRQLEEHYFAEDLRAAYTLASTTATIAAPSTHQRLLEVIVQTAAQVIAAQAGTLFLIDTQSQELIFEVTIGDKAADVAGLRVPLGHGIAGLVALTGQAMIITDAEDNPLQASDIAHIVGYTPHSIICVPLYYRDHIIGVLELLDKSTASSFTEEDVHLLGIFADQAGMAIEQSRTYQHLVSLFTQVVQSLKQEPEHHKEQLLARAHAFVEQLETGDAEFQFALKLATMIQEISWAGDHEQELCLQMIQLFVGYLHKQPQLVSLQ